jgi:hypothetical protein
MKADFLVHQAQIGSMHPSRAVKSVICALAAERSSAHTMGKRASAAPCLPAGASRNNGLTVCDDKAPMGFSGT